MTETDRAEPDDLSGVVDERISQLASLEASPAHLSEEWLRRQLHSALAAWARNETLTEIEAENRTDY